MIIIDTIKHYIIRDILCIRPMDNYIKHNYHGSFSFCEIGILDGKHAQRMIKYHKPKSIYLIDIEIKNKVRHIFSKWHNVNIVEGDSNIVFDGIPKVDFIYIDGDHSYKGVKNDLKYFTKAKYILGGHDFQLHGVHTAVMEFCFKHKIIDKLIVCGTDWWIVK